MLAAAATMAMLGIPRVKTNLLHVLSLLMVLSMGVDYRVFLVECGRQGNLGPTTMSLSGSALTTMLSFGLLALSSTQALRAIGLTVGIGMALSFLLAPLDPHHHARRVGGDAMRRARCARGRGWQGGKASNAWNAGAGHARVRASGLATAGCIHHETAPPPREGPAPPTAAELPPPGMRSPGTFDLRQKLTATLAEGGGSFEAVLQKQPGTLTLVGLTPYGSRAFLLQQTKGDVQFTKYIPRELPFAPTFLLLDIHRVLATWLGPPLPAGERSGQAGDETIHERWQDGKLIERTFASAKAQAAGTITITYAGYDASRLSPPTSPSGMHAWITRS